MYVYIYKEYHRNINIKEQGISRKSKTIFQFPLNSNGILMTVFLGRCFFVLDQDDVIA